MRCLTFNQSSDVQFSCCRFNWYLACFIFWVNRGFFLSPYAFSSCSRRQLLMVFLSKTIFWLAYSMQRFLQEALLPFSAIALIFLSGLSIVFLFRPHFPVLELWIFLPVSSFFLMTLTVWVDMFNFLAISFCVRSLCLSKRLICLFFWTHILPLFHFSKLVKNLLIFVSDWSYPCKLPGKLSNDLKLLVDSEDLEIVEG